MLRPDSSPESLIHRAARLGNLAELERLLAQGVDINTKADLEYDRGPFLRGLTPLMVAARSDDGVSVETLRWLIEHGADLHARSEGGVTAAWYAAGMGTPWHVEEHVATPDRVERLRFLLDVGLDPNEAVGRSRSLLAEACRAGDPARVALLLGRRAPAVPPVDPERAKQSTEEGAGRQCNNFVEAGVPEDLSESSLRLYFPEHQSRLSAYVIPLFSAAKSGSVECVRLILAAVTAHYAGEDKDLTPLMLEASTEAALALLEAGADLQVVDVRGSDVLQAVLREDTSSPDGPSAWLAVAQALVEATATLERRDPRGRVRLYDEAFRQNEDAVWLLLYHGADPRARRGDGKTPLHAACWHTSPPAVFETSQYPEGRIIEILIETGGEVGLH